MAEDRYVAEGSPITRTDDGLVAARLSQTTPNSPTASYKDGYAKGTCVPAARRGPSLVLRAGRPSWCPIGLTRMSASLRRIPIGRDQQPPRLRAVSSESLTEEGRLLFVDVLWVLPVLVYSTPEQGVEETTAKFIFRHWHYPPSHEGPAGLCKIQGLECTGILPPRTLPTSSVALTTAQQPPSPAPPSPTSPLEAKTYPSCVLFLPPPRPKSDQPPSKEHA